MSILLKKVAQIAKLGSRTHAIKLDAVSSTHGAPGYQTTDGLLISKD